VYTPQLFVTGLFTSDPIVTLQDGTALELRFDDFNSNARQMMYRFVHCNADWTPSALDPLEYLEGFQEDRIRDFLVSNNTLASYIHFRLRFPNEYTRWTKSGNYVLQIYLDDDKRTPVLSRRFIVMENLVQIILNPVRAALVENMNSHHELDITVNPKKVPIQTPALEATLVVLQNWDWSNSKSIRQPQFTQPDKLIYDFQNKLVWPGGNEFRWLDLRSLTRTRNNIASVKRDNGQWHVYLKMDQPRNELPYNYYKDLDGKYVVEESDNSRISSNVANDYNDALDADYAWVHFVLNFGSSAWDLPQQLYLVGQFSDFKCDTIYEMTPNEDGTRWEGKFWLKQGYYDYQYQGIWEGNPRPTFIKTEGSFFDTENKYRAFFYWKEPGSRYDRCLGNALWESPGR
jgi:mRNA-degrading endonuclease RelE of RelBE toxin-antitoxin system